MKKYIHALIAFLLVACFVETADAQSPTLGTFDRWVAMTATDNDKQVCFITSEPIASKGKYKKRDKVIAFVTHRPGDKQFDVVSHVAGYTFKANNAVIVAIGSKNFSFFTKDDTAWAKDSTTDQAVIQAMKKGKNMIVVGTSKRGTQTSDTYSLKGFTAAYDAISKACGKK